MTEFARHTYRMRRILHLLWVAYVIVLGRQSWGIISIFPICLGPLALPLILLLALLSTIISVGIVLSIVQRAKLTWLKFDGIETTAVILARVDYVPTARASESGWESRYQFTDWLGRTHQGIVQSKYYDGWHEHPPGGEGNEHNFDAAFAQGATFPLIYSRRFPTIRNEKIQWKSTVTYYLPDLLESD